jgi:hypothetical protein
VSKHHGECDGHGAHQHDQCERQQLADGRAARKTYDGEQTEDRCNDQEQPAHQLGDNLVEMQLRRGRAHELDGAAKEGRCADGLDGAGRLALACQRA